MVSGSQGETEIGGEMKPSRAQLRVLRLMVQANGYLRRQFFAYRIDGHGVAGCTSATVIAMERKGLIQKLGILSDTMEITPAGRAEVIAAAYPTAKEEK